LSQYQLQINQLLEPVFINFIHESNKISTGGKIKPIFVVPRTKHGELAKELIEKELELEKITGYKCKIVERGGVMIHI